MHSNVEERLKKRLKDGKKEEQLETKRRKIPTPPLTSPFPRPPCIVYALSPRDYDVPLDEPSSSRLSEAIIRLISAGTPIWEGGSRTVVQISDDVVVKVGKDLEHDEIDFLKFLEEQVPGILPPRALGLVTVGPTSYMFMTCIRGTTLQQRWPTLFE
ncbi:hypothetical protein ARMSODRAFT_332855 [Armillaria solidipes]|uniref:Uncharacterized protein n=1 Tax=Armillaria solidipes TaxID=1076256 RepID=A0A2H3BBA5_9AGAR|nr:hypothetical protein ARMSODRAFT_332855 [Armillaria solidipes]